MSLTEHEVLLWTYPNPASTHARDVGVSMDRAFKFMSIREVLDEHAGELTATADDNIANAQKVPVSASDDREGGPYVNRQATVIADCEWWFADGSDRTVVWCVRDNEPVLPVPTPLYDVVRVQRERPDLTVDECIRLVCDGMTGHSWSLVRAALLRATRLDLLRLTNT